MGLPVGGSHFETKAVKRKADKLKMAADRMIQPQKTMFISSLRCRFEWLRL